MKKPREVIFREFVGTDHTSEDEDDWSSSGDVKYHLGVSCDSDGVRQKSCTLRTLSVLPCYMCCCMSASL